MIASTLTLRASSSSATSSWGMAVRSTWSLSGRLSYTLRQHVMTKAGSDATRRDDDEPAESIEGRALLSLRIFEATYPEAHHGGLWVVVSDRKEDGKVVPGVAMEQVSSASRSAHDPRRRCVRATGSRSSVPHRGRDGGRRGGVRRWA